MIESRLELSLEQAKSSEINDRLASESIDTSLPGRKNYKGRVHPISKEIERTADVLAQMGFSLYYTTEIESEYYNYGGLNYPDDHPASDMQDT